MTPLRLTPPLAPSSTGDPQESALVQPDPGRQSDRGIADMLASRPEDGTWWKAALIAALFPLFGQTFHYMKDLPALWALSKMFPLFALPLGLVLVFRPRIPFAAQIAVTFVWLVVCATLASRIAFKQGAMTGIWAQVKLLPLLSFYSFLGMLVIVRPALIDIRRALVACAVVTLAVLIALWLFAPQHWYVTSIDVGDAPLLSYDERGNRIRMPMYFPLIAIFLWQRLALKDGRGGYWIAILAAFAIALFIVRTRAVMIAGTATLAVAMMSSAGPRLRVLGPTLIPAAVFGLLHVPYIASIFDTDASGYTVREITARKAVDFLGDDWINWLLGVGSISPTKPQGMAKFFNHYFFLADITWLGIIFEFGILGALMLAALPLRGMFFLSRLRQRRDDPLLGALQDYCLYVLIVSPLYPIMTMQPGEVTVILAIAAYVATRLSWTQKAPAGRTARPRIAR